MYQPYDYQDECVTAVTEARSRGSRTNLIVMASGLGKTATVGFLTRKWRKKEKGRVLYLCHQNEILEQAQETFQLIIGDEPSYGFLNGFEKKATGVDFLFASFQTIQNLLHLFAKDEFIYVFVDESHHSHAETYKAVIDYFEPEYLLGFTATPDRLDEKDIQEIYGDVAYSLPLPEALARGLLAPVDYRILTDELQLKQVIDVPERQLSIRLLNKKIFVPKRDEEIVSIIRRHTSEMEEPRTILFCSSVAHCDHLSTIMEEGIAIHSGISRAERKVRLELFRQGLVSTVLTVDVFNEGIDVPEANVIVFLRSTSSRSIFLQQLGRGLRRSAMKKNVRILDFVGNCERLKMVVELQEEVKERRSFERTTLSTSDVNPFKLNVDAAEFVERVVPLLELLNRMNTNFYVTWQEASAAAIKLGITDYRDYRKRCSADPRLPAAPYSFYTNFPGVPIFLGQGFYPTWQEATAAAVKLKIKSSRVYRADYKKDPRLPSHPDLAYQDFPGWPVYLGKKPEGTAIYPTWKEASAAAVRLGIKNQKDYQKRYKEDPCLPAVPGSYYEDFPGLAKFLGKTQD